MRQKPKNPSRATVGTGEKTAKDRRGFVIDQLLEKQCEEVTFADLITAFGVTEQTLYNDDDYFSAQGIPIVVENKRFKRGYEHLNTVGRRRGTRKAEKEAIARVATDLVASPAGTPILNEVVQYGAGGKNQDARTIAHSLLRQPHGEWRMSDELASRLLAYWSKAHRLLILDAGSTTEAIARRLSQVETPSPERHLAGLRVLTNGSMIVKAFAEGKNRHLGLILLGGARRSDTDATAGSLAEQCLAAWRFQADVAIIGSTNLQWNRGFCCDSEEEAEIKSRLLHTARIRCIAADSSKLISPSIGSAWPFAPFHPSEVDIIITDWHILERREADEFEKLRRRFIDQVVHSGIYVLVGPGREEVQESNAKTAQHASGLRSS
jgi:DeoR/GlpR family transcriptional regulator of sugar metabolism